MPLFFVKAFYFLKALSTICFKARPRRVRIKTIHAELNIIVMAANQSIDENESGGNNINAPAVTSTKYVKIACVERNIIKYSLFDKLTAYK